MASPGAYGVALRFVYDLSGQLIAEQASSGGALREYIRLDGMILGFVSGGVLHWIHQDHIGRTRMVAAQNGDVAWKTTWGPFGKLLTGKTSGTVPTDLRFPGQYWDWESGLAYNGFRDYEHATGRYVQSDPIGLAGGWNTYAYVGGNPVMRVDPSGLAGHANHGPYHLPDGVKTKCDKTDLCPVLKGKMFNLTRMITSHAGWAARRGGHAQELSELWMQLVECSKFSSRKRCVKKKKMTFGAWVARTCLLPFFIIIPESVICEEFQDLPELDLPMCRKYYNGPRA